MPHSDRPAIDTALSRSVGRCLATTFLVLIVLGVSFAASADHLDEYEYTIYRSGKSIGYHRVTFQPRDGHVEVKEKSHLRVRAGFLTLYQFDHERSEVWKDGVLTYSKGKTNRNGKELDITVEANGHGYFREVNGKVDRLDPSRKVLALWDKSILDHKSFFSVVEDKTIDVSFQYGGKQKLQLSGRELDVDYYKMTGDEEREVWYDQAGHVVRVKLRRFGSDIEYVLKLPE
ncbi:MAG: DUF6134 family protein [Alphaproteobacteria bacterium]